MNSPTVLKIPDLRHRNETLTTVSPNLMPFHIAYSGPVPMSTYFMPRPFVDEREERRRALIGKEEGKSGDVDGVGEVDPMHNNTRDKASCGESKDRNLDGSGKEDVLCAAFRGRIVVGQPICLPEAYTGLMLLQESTPHAETDSHGQGQSVQGTQQAKAKAKSSSERAKALKAKAAAKLKNKRSRRHQEDEEEAEGAEGGEGDEEVLDGDGENVSLIKESVPRTFVAKGRFDTFTLWHPDGPVDKTRDEYIRSLNDWITLAAEVRTSDLLDICRANPFGRFIVYNIAHLPLHLFILCILLVELHDHLFALAIQMIQPIIHFHRLGIRLGDELEALHVELAFQFIQSTLGTL